MTVTSKLQANAERNEEMMMMIEKRQKRGCSFERRWVLLKIPRGDIDELGEEQ